MRRGLTVIAVLAAAGVAFYVWHGRKSEGDAAKPGPKSAKPMVVPKIERKKAAPTSAAPAPERVSQEDDPKGSLRLEGQVIDADEKPVGGATVTLSSHPPRSIKTEQDGSFAFDQLVGRRYRLAAKRGPEYAGPVTANLTKTSEPVVLRMRRGSVLEVTVVDSAHRKPLVGAEVRLGEADDTVVTTSADGTAVIDGIAPGFHRVSASAKGHGPVTRYFQVSGTPGAKHAQTIALDPGAAISGTVVDAQGKPVAGATVSAERASATFFDRTSVSAKSDGKGAFRIDAVGAGTYRLSATHRAHARGASPLLTLDGKTPREGVRIELGDGVRLTGRVVTKAGAPAQAARVRAVTKTGGIRGFVRQVYCDEQGTFELSGLPKENVQLVATTQGAASPVVDVDLGAGPPADPVTLTLEVEGRIAGVVVDDSGEPVAEAQVVLQPKDIMTAMSEWRLRGRAAEVADQAGKFEFRGVADGSYRVAAAAPGSVGRIEMIGWGSGPHVSAKTGDTNVRIVLTKDGSITGKVVFEDGSTPKAFTVAVGFRPATPFVDTKGSFTVRNVPAGTHELRVSGGGILAKYVDKVEVKSGTEKDVGTIEVQKGRSVRGRVLTTSGAPVAGATVVASMFIMGDGAKLNTQMIDAAKSAVTGDDGRFELFGIGERQLVMLADHGQSGRSPMASIPEGKQDVTMDLVIEATGGAKGTVSRGGKPIPAMVTAVPHGAQRVRFMVRAGADGSYRFDRLAPGTYVINAKNMASGMMIVASGGVDEHARLTVKSGEVANLDIKIPEGPTLTVNIAGAAGKPAPNASVSLLRGKGMPKKLSDMAKPGGSARTAPSFTQGGMNMPAKFDNVEPGEYTVCAVALPDVGHGGGRVEIKMDEDVAPTCKHHTVAATPEQQSVTIALTSK